MSAKSVDAGRVLAFLRQLGECYRHPGIVYLVGGSSLLLLAAKTTTADIDIQFVVPNEGHTEFIRCLRQISREMGIPIEQASPAEFVPLPAGYEERRHFVGHFGLLDVFHFDFYSVALSKLLRGSEKDYGDLISMLRGHVIDMASLELYFQEVLPKIEDYNLRQSTRDFEKKFALLKQRLAGANA